MSRPRPEKWIRQVARRIAERVRPKKIILFGSHAYGKPKSESDLDLLVILPRRLPDRFQTYHRVNAAVGERQWPLDLLIKGLDEIESRLKIGDSFVIEIMTRGKILYAAPERAR